MQWSDNERKRENLLQETKGLWNASNSLSWEKQQTFRDPTTSFPAEWHLRNKCRNSMLMTCHWPDMGRVSDWTCCAGNLLQPIRNTTQIWVVTRHQYGVSALVSKTSFTEKPVVASPNISCFLRLVLFTTPKRAHVWWKLNYGQTYTTGFKWPLIINLWRWI